ncbi:MAG: response regulator transcription factor [Janthinobacterium lividum]
MKVLIVEDDRALGLFLQKGLKLEGHDTTWVEDGELALERLGADCPDLMVLDLGLPRRDGMEVLQELRNLSPATAVLVLTGRNNLEERIRCLNLGADDCLLKPFSFHELAARCRAILRRQKGPEDSVLRFNGIEMDLIRRKVRYQETNPELTPKEFSLLEALLRREGNCCSREELLREVWQVHSETETNVVDVFINSLRRKLVIAPLANIARSALIETVRGKGYRIASTPVRMPAQAVEHAKLAYARGA